MGRSRNLDFSPGLRSVDDGCAAGHRNFSARLHALLAALTSASDFSFFLSHRMSPFPESFERRGERLKILARRPAVNVCSAFVRFLRPPRVLRASGPSRLRVAPRFAPRRAARVTNPCMLYCPPACPGET